MTVDDVTETHLVLFLVCCVYAVILSRRPVYNWYHPDWTWVTVVVGCGFIGLTQKALIDQGITLTFGLILSTNITAGVPIIAWQLGEWIVRRITRRKGRG